MCFSPCVSTPFRNSTTFIMASSIATGFVRKLYRMLEEEDASIIGWEASGTHFTIRDEDRLNSHVLLKYYRGKLTAFRQQLLNHGFERDPTASDQETYNHAYFVRGNPAALSQITCVEKPKIKGPPRKTSNKINKVARQEPYPTRKPTHIPIVPGSDEDTVWRFLVGVCYSDDKLTFNPSMLTTNPGFTPSIVQLAIDDPAPPSFEGPNPLFAKTSPPNPLFGAKPSLTPHMAPPLQVLNPVPSSSSNTNPLFDKSATPTGFGALPAPSSSGLPASTPLFQRHNSLGGDQWLHLVSSSVDRFMKFSDTFDTPEDAFKFVLEERQKLEKEKTKLDDAALPDVSTSLFNGLANQGPDALISFLMTSSIDQLQKGIETIECIQQQHDQHADTSDHGEEDEWDDGDAEM
ncbi:hypothetical protein DYB32_005653 [Aphanomyces invadans]|uniref:HSF-type DNA-binding domain-containing protein n=1 Tax=Aphanomyces invadans TaxID=157072 RepID=A0A418ATY8_9STRA|nr:hypothetical protein DYB32_005653 [Aphanomyces invadans]